MPLEPSRRTRPSPALPAVFASLLLGLPGCGRAPETAATPSPTPAASATVALKRGSAPLPAPGESGIRPHHGGLVEKAGKLNLELYVVEGKAKVWVYDETGKPVRESEMKGRLKATADGESQTVDLVPVDEEADRVLVGAAVLPAAFEAEIEVEVAGSTETARLRYATAGVPGSSAVPESEQRKAGAEALPPRPAPSPPPTR